VLVAVVVVQAVDDATVDALCAPELQDKQDAVAVGRAICALQLLAAQMRARRLASAVSESIMPGDDRNNDGLFCVDRDSGKVRFRDGLHSATDADKQADPAESPVSAAAGGDAGGTAAHVAWTGQESHQLVEEFMLLANGLVAQKLEAALESAGGGAVLRVQAAPSQARLKSWCELCVANGYSDARSRESDEPLDVNTIPRVVCDLLGQLRETMAQQPKLSKEVAVAEALQWTATRSNTAAKYVCTTAVDALEEGASTQEPAGDDTVDGGDSTAVAVEAELTMRKHYSLNCAAYTHFTSPIRRYADLLVHRQLRAVLAAEGQLHAAGSGLDPPAAVSSAALDAALNEQGVSRAQIVDLVERTNRQAKEAKYTQQDCERLLALKYVAEMTSAATAATTSAADGLEETAVILSVDENNLKLLIPRLDLEHTVRVRDLGCKTSWDGEQSLLRVFPGTPPADVEPRRGGGRGGRGRGNAQAGAGAGAEAAAAVDAEEGEPPVVNVQQLAVLRVRAQASFGGRQGTPSLRVDLVASA
jgi:hypothetical protein